MFLCVCVCVGLTWYGVAVYTYAFFSWMEINVTACNSNKSFISTAVAETPGVLYVSKYVSDSPAYLVGFTMSGLQVLSCNCSW